MRRRYLLCYDIRDPVRLREVHHTAKAYGRPLQYSVFVCDLNRTERIQVEAALREVMRISVDSVVFVDLGESTSRGTDCFEFIGHRPFDLPSQGPTIV